MWLVNRLSERTSQAAIAVAVTAVSNVATRPEAWAPGCLPLWLGLIATLTPCVIGILVPEGVTVAPWVASPPAGAGGDHEAPRGQQPG